MSDWKDRNQEHFDATASEYDQHNRADEMTTKGANAIAAEFKAVNPNHQEARAFEFGIGTGLVAVKLAPSVKSILGVDISEEMLKQVQKKIEDPANAAVASKIQTVQHLVTDEAPLPEALLKDNVVSAGGQGFDLVYTNMVMHHVENAPKVIQSIVQHFVKKESGWFFMVDIQYVKGISEIWHKLVRELFHAPKEGEGEGHHHHHHHHHHGHGHDHGHAHAHGHEHGKEHGDGHHGHHHHHHQHHHHHHEEGEGATKGKRHEVADIVPYSSGFKDDDLRQWFTEAGLVDIVVKTGFTMEFFVPSMNKEVSFQYVIAGGRRA
ncbi:hypothetical protein DFQ27_001637 [Actinomortierella ambigua]|uniref:S-adenosyl-L-methionine-dependent methyltransferase n=1 Tax=Actinomortierella ambigua TaxID=1343610 RepID=A0A9P6QCK7_9FUNG|nr:hypothetical protein DFQ26_005689 [Actinomortierella ambigua]KAG0263680.1 hypothetical protein DFQ27_001637 [Actinomortierella ambigua]